MMRRSDSVNKCLSEDTISEFSSLKHFCTRALSHLPLILARAASISSRRCDGWGSLSAS
jgi:hypothetical protein